MRVEDMQSHEKPLGKNSVLLASFGSDSSIKQRAGRSYLVDEDSRISEISALKIEIL